MENNIFYKNRMAIRDISEQEGVPVDIAVEIWCKRKNVSDTATASDRLRFMAELRRYQLDPKLTLADFFS